MARIDLRPGGGAELHRLAGTTFNRELAPILEIDESSLSRLITGKTKPGIPFVAGVLLAFGTQRFDDIFAVVSDDEVQA